jgi:hypothetical protein
MFSFIKNTRQRKTPWPLFAFALVLLLATGCSSSGRLNDFQQFAAIGSSYTQAVDASLIATGRLAITANSIELVESRDLAAVSREDLQRQDEAVKGFLKELALLREQTLSLNDYFQGLATLSGSKAPEQFAAGLNQSAGALSSISASVAGGSRLGQSADAAASAGAALVAKQRMKYLEEELQLRNKTIAEVLALQESLLAALVGIAAEHQAFVGERTWEGSVAAPFKGTNPLACQDLWMADREAALLASPLTGRLELVAKAAQEMRSVWPKLVSKDLEPLDLAVLSKAVGDALGGPVGLPATQYTTIRGLCPAAP